MALDSTVQNDAFDIVPIISPRIVPELSPGGKKKGFFLSESECIDLSFARV